MNEMSHKPEAATTASRRVIALRQGRGRQGGSTTLDLLIQLARREGRPVLVGDGDRNNSTLTGLYPPDQLGGASHPKTEQLVDVLKWITASVNEAIQSESSLVVDLGGGDRVMEEYGRDLGLVEFCEASGYEPLGLYFCGPEVNDLKHIHTIWRAGYFRPRRAILVFQEYLVPRGQAPQGAFDEVITSREMEELLKDSFEFIFFPRLPCMDEVRRSGLSFADAASGMRGAEGKPLDPIQQFMVKQWIDRAQKAFAKIGATEWLP